MLQNLNFELMGYIVHLMQLDANLNNNPNLPLIGDREIEGEQVLCQSNDMRLYSE